ncbi:MAG: hypothetical protein EPO13_10820 [Actinomycetota bacterium]|nr:MAG: hypothetical protein EPO13_10820 [Actinomycetota bacterium]
MSADRHLGEWVSGLLDGALSGAERDRALAHLARCPQCRDEVDAVRQLKAALRDCPPPPPGLLDRLREAPPRIVRAADAATESLPVVDGGTSPAALTPTGLTPTGSRPGRLYRTNRRAGRLARPQWRRARVTLIAGGDAPRAAQGVAAAAGVPRSGTATGAARGERTRPGRRRSPALSAGQPRRHRHLRSVVGGAAVAAVVCVLGVALVVPHRGADPVVVPPVGRFAAEHDATTGGLPVTSPGLRVSQVGISEGLGAATP